MYHLIYILEITLFLLCTQGVKSGNSVCSNELGLGDRTKITDQQLTASSEKGSGYPARDGRIMPNVQGWCANQYLKIQQWFHVDFKNTNTVTSVKIAGLREAPAEHVKKFSLKYSYDNVVWYNYTYKGKELLENNVDIPKVVFPYPITARWIGIYPLEWTGDLCMRIEFYGCIPTEDCKIPAGMEDRRIADKQITASTYRLGHFSYEGRLHNKAENRGNKTKWGAWCADETDLHPYLQIDLLRKRNVSAVATQGYRSFGLYVKNYKVNYSTDGVTWLSCQNKQRQIKFEGNNDNDTVKQNELEPRVAAQYIRFIPLEWNASFLCMRVEIYECLPVKGSVPDIDVDKPSQQIMDIDQGGNITFSCTMKGQAGIIIDWYRKGVLIKESKRFNIKTEDLGNDQVQSKLSLYNVTINENGVKFECRGRYPNVSLFTSSETLLRVGVYQPPVEVRSKTENSVEIGVPYRLANITVEYKFEFRVVNESKWKEKKYPRMKKNIYSIMGLVPWTEYELKVTPIHRDNLNDPGRTSRIERFRTLQGVPDPLENVRTSQVNANNVTITWDVPSKDQIRGILTDYVIKVHNNVREISYQEIGVTTNYIVRDLAPETNYTVKVALKNERKQSLFRSVFFTTQSDLPEPLTTQKPHSNSKTNLEKLNQIKITDNNAMGVAMGVEKLTSVPEELNSRNVSTAAEILRKIVDTNATNPTVGDSILETISNVLDTKGNVLENSNSSSKFIKILEDFVVKGGEFSKNTSNIKIRIVRSFDIRNGVFEQKFTNDSTIIIPKEVLNKAKNKTMYFIYYKNGNIFKPKRFSKEVCGDNGFTEDVYEQSTPVMSSGVPGESVKNLTEKVIIKFHVGDPKAVTESSSCVFWDFHAAGGKGDWSNKGCTRQKTYGNTIVCACDHMTNFAALIDVYAETSKACGVHADILQIVSYAGCCLSITGLSLTIFTYMFFRRLRKELAAKILIQLCVALLCVMVVFVVGIERSRVGAIGCYIVAVLLHYFILAAFLWMLIEAHFMYLAFVKVWSQHGDHELLKCSFIAWGLPAIVVGITMAVNLDNYGGGYYCRIEKIAFYTAFFAPVMCIIFVNLIVFGIIMYKLNTRPDSSLGRNRSAMMQRMKQAVGIMILVGLTWIFGALAISGVRLVFNYIFVFFNSIQGFCIFLFYCLSQKSVRVCWKALLTCKLKTLQKDKSFHTNTYDRRRCSTASTTHNNTLSLASKKTSTSSANTAYPSHSMDTLSREFTSYNCTSETLPGSKEGSKPNNLNNFKLKDCNIQNGSASNGDTWKRMSNTNDQTPNSVTTDIPITRSNSSETLCSDDSSENYHSYDLVASSEGSLVSLHSLAESQASDNRGFYSFVNPDSCDNSVHGDSAPSTPGEVRRLMPNPTTNNNLLTVPTPTKRKLQQPKPTNNDPLPIPDDFGKLIVNPSRGSVRGVRGVVETSVDTYDEDSDANITPQSLRLTEVLNNEHSDKFGSNECIDSPMYFAQNNRGNLKDRNPSTTDNPVRDVCL